MNRWDFARGLKSDIRLSKRDRKQIIRQSINSDSWKLKCTIVMEEFAELQQQVSKQIRARGEYLGLLEEMADAYISLRYLESIFRISPHELKKAIDVKLQREKERISNDKNRKNKRNGLGTGYSGNAQSDEQLG